MSEDNPRKLLDLVVREVSLVDRAANLRKFVVVKRTEPTEEAMGNFQQENEKKEDVQKGFPPDVMNAIKATADWLKQKAAERGAPPEAAPLAAFLGKVAAGGYPYPAPGGYPYPENMHKADGKKPVQDEEDVTKAKKAAPVEDEETAKAKKIAEDELQKAKQKVQDEEEVEKSSKRFTKGRIQAIQESMVKLLSMLNGVDEGALSQALEKALPKQVEEEEAMGKGGKGGKIPTCKSEDVEAVQKSLDEINRRVEAIEKARTPSQGAGGDDTVSVQKAQSFWRGIL